jgi:hypothetical protein
LKKLVSILFWAALPAAALAQPAPQILRTLDFVTPPGSAVSGVAHVEEVKIGDRQQIRTVVTTNDGSAEMTFDGRTIALGDGYTIVKETLANTNAVLVVRLTATAPDGSSESAVILWNRQSAEATSVGADRYARLLSGSHDAVLAARILSQLTFSTAQSSGLHGKGLGSITIHGSDCLAASLAVEAACVGVMLGCASENPAVCLLALYNLANQIDNMTQQCPPPNYTDTIGWG